MFRLFAYLFPLIGFFYIYISQESRVEDYYPLVSIHLLVFWISMLFFLVGLPGLQQVQTSRPIWLRLFPGSANPPAVYRFSHLPALERQAKPSGWLGLIGMSMLLIAGLGSLVFGLSGAFEITQTRVPLIYVGSRRFIPDVGSPFINGYYVVLDWNVSMVLLFFSVAGGVLWGIAIVKGSAVPRWTGVLFAIGSVLNILSLILGYGLFQTGDGLFGTNDLWRGSSFALSMLISILLSTSMIQWGYTLIKSQRASHARVV